MYLIDMTERHCKVVPNRHKGGEFQEKKTFMRFSFVEIMDIHILEKEAGKKWLNHCPRHIMRP